MKKMRVSPDGLIQFALQMAYFNIAKTFPLTYEAAITTLFNHGRTETIRTNSASISATVKEIAQLTNETDDKQKRDIRRAIIECIEGNGNKIPVLLRGKLNRSLGRFVIKTRTFFAIEKCYGWKRFR